MSSAGLIQTLLDQTAGANRLRSFISELAIYTGPQRDLLVKHFPGLQISRNSLSKWWALQMATMSEPSVFESMTAEETELALDSALVVEFQVPIDPEPDQAAPSEPAVKKPSLGARVRRLFGGGSARVEAPDVSETADADIAGTEAEVSEPEMETVTCRIEDVAVYLPQKNLESILSQEQADLVRVSNRAHPLYRNVILSYQATIGSFNAETEIAEAEAELAKLIARRTTIQRQAEAVADHLNWYEATQLNRTSGKFDRFFEQLDKIDSDSRSRRSDPISQYLDALEREFRP